MWLLNTTTINLHPFVGKNIPPYVILSHTWGHEEVSFQDIQSPETNNSDSLGYSKIKACCEMAKGNGFEYAWIDTCCIDKTNSAELSEAINSMFAWYQNAIECYAYLSDVEKLADISQSKWFTRGWTLQELLAPRTVVFFNGCWNELGTKASLSEEVSVITKIPRSAILNLKLEEFSVAQRMSWAAQRETTREEDIAYSLLGIFGVNMPMIYGEGKDAFRRLQLEIMKISDDHSLFAWTVGPIKLRRLSVLALSPSMFKSCGGIRKSTKEWRDEFVMTNIGLRIKLPLTFTDHHWRPIGGRSSYCVAFLDCMTEGGREVGIYLSNGFNKAPNQFRRTRGSDLETVMTSDGLPLEEIFIQNNILLPSPPTEYVLKVTCFSIIENGYYICESEPTWGAQWPVYDTKFQSGLYYDLNLKGFGTAGGLIFRHLMSGKRFALMLGNNTGHIWSDIETNIGEDEILDGIINSYQGRPSTNSEVLQRRYSSRFNYLDRIVRPLSDGRFAQVIIRNKPPVTGKRVCHVEFSICYKDLESSTDGKAKDNFILMDEGEEETNSDEG